MLLIYRINKNNNKNNNQIQYYNLNKINKQKNIYSQLKQIYNSYKNNDFYAIKYYYNYIYL